MPNSSNESSPSPPEDQSSGGLKPEVPRPSDAATEPVASIADTSVRDEAFATFVVQPTITLRPPEPSVADLRRRLAHIQLTDYVAYKRKQLRTSVILFLLTLLSTFLVGSDFWPLHYLAAQLSPLYDSYLRNFILPVVLRYGAGEEMLDKFIWEKVIEGAQYAVPLMSILFFHEMGHFLQSRWNRVPASLPYFIPMPIPPMGTMGAVIFQGRGVATRRQMFDIAVCGPIAGLIVTLPVLWYGLNASEFVSISQMPPFQFGKPLLIQWMEYLIHGAAPVAKFLDYNNLAFAGWVGVLITAMNLLPVGQLDGGHILYTLIGKKAHRVALLVIGAGFAAMLIRQDFSFSLLLLLLLLTGPRHPPTANDNEPLGLWRHIVGWLTLSFLIIGFTPQPIAVGNPEPDGRNTPQERVKPAVDVVQIPWRTLPACGYDFPGPGRQDAYPTIQG